MEGKSQTMKEKLFNNLSLKILSVLCAIVLWAIIVNIYDPTTGVTISNVNVELINTGSLTANNYTYEVVEGSKISVYISGPKSVITDIKSSDIVATADLSKISAFASYVDIHVKVVKDGREIDNIEVTPRTTAVKLEIENRVTKEFDIKPIEVGAVNDGYVMTELNCYPNTLRVTGPSSLVESINSVGAQCDLNGLYTDYSGTANIVLFDADDNAIENDALVLSRTEVEYKVKVNLKKTVKVKCLGTIGEVRQGYIFKGLELSLEEVTILGEAQAVNQIQEIVIPASELNINGCSANKIFTIQLSKFVDSAISFQGDSIVEVTALIAAENSKDISINVKDIQFNNVLDGYKVSVQDRTELFISVVSDYNSLELITSQDIVASVNMTLLTEGVHTVSVNFALPQGYRVSGSYRIKVLVEKEENETTTTDTTVD